MSAELVKIPRCLQYRTVSTLAHFCVPTSGTFLGYSVFSPDFSLQAPPDRKSLVLKLAPSGQYTQVRRRYTNYASFEGPPFPYRRWRTFSLFQLLRLSAVGGRAVLGLWSVRSKGPTLLSARSKGQTLLRCCSKGTTLLWCCSKGPTLLWCWS